MLPTQGPLNDAEGSIWPLFFWRHFQRVVVSFERSDNIVATSRVWPILTRSVGNISSRSLALRRPRIRVRTAREESILPTHRVSAPRADCVIKLHLKDVSAICARATSSSRGGHADGSASTLACECFDGDRNHVPAILYSFIRLHFMQGKLPDVTDPRPPPNGALVVPDWRLPQCSHFF